MRRAEEGEGPFSLVEKSGGPKGPRGDDWPEVNRWVGRRWERPPCLPLLDLDCLPHFESLDKTPKLEEFLSKKVDRGISSVVIERV